jgi:polyhydroxyalkanoate synthesis regulator protein
MPAPPDCEPILVKRYAQCRLHDTAGRRYVSLDQLRGWAAEGVAFRVIDGESGADMTRTLLA